jgi:hypothetical protein
LARRQHRASSSRRGERFGLLVVMPDSVETDTVLPCPSPVAFVFLTLVYCSSSRTSSLLLPNSSTRSSPEGCR